MNESDTPIKQLVKQIWYRDGLAFECQGCGACCSGDPGYVWANEDECKAMSQKLGISPEEFKAQYTREAKNRISLLERDNGDCVLLDEEARTCKTYNERPTQCRTWPWWPENLKTKAAWERCKKECPGIGTGRTHTPSFILQQVQKDKAAENK